MITYRITNAVPEADKVRVFVEFSNGQSNSNLFEITDTIAVIQAWIQSRIAFFEQRELEIKNRVDEIIEEVS